MIIGLGRYAVRVARPVCCIVTNGPHDTCRYHHRRSCRGINKNVTKLCARAENDTATGITACAHEMPTIIQFRCPAKSSPSPRRSRGSCEQTTRPAECVLLTVCVVVYVHVVRTEGVDVPRRPTREGADAKTKIRPYVPNNFNDSVQYDRYPVEAVLPDRDGVTHTYLGLTNEGCGCTRSLASIVIGVAVPRSRRLLSAVDCWRCLPDANTFDGVQNTCKFHSAHGCTGAVLVFLIGCKNLCRQLRFFSPPLKKNKF